MCFYFSSFIQVTSPSTQTAQAPFASHGTLKSSWPSYAPTPVWCVTWRDTPTTVDTAKTKIQECTTWRLMGWLRHHLTAMHSPQSLYMETGWSWKDTGVSQIECFCFHPDKRTHTVIKESQLYHFCLEKELLKNYFLCESSPPVS